MGDLVPIGPADRGAGLVDPALYPPRLALARTPTPLEPLPSLSRALGVELWVKRDDLTDTPMSGNKLRKLEFLLADARAQGCDAVITTGGVQSNHARATAIAAVRLGLRPYLLLRGAEATRPRGAGIKHCPDLDPSGDLCSGSDLAPVPQGNLLLDRLVGAEVRFITRAAYANRGELMRAWAAELAASRGQRAYVIPEGGSDEVGSWGYVSGLDETLAQARGLGVRFDTIVHAAGSGGTSAGLALGKKLLGFAGRTLGFAVCDDAAYFTDVAGGIIERAIARWSLPLDFDRGELSFDDGFVGAGYAQTRPEEIANLIEVAQSEGLFLDPVYTNKAFFGMASTLRRDRKAYGERVLFLHTGGLFGLFAQADALAAGLVDAP